MIKKFKYWSIVYKESPSILGQCAFILNKETPNFSHISAEQMAEFPKVCKWYENKLNKLFGAEKFNYCAIMMKEQFVHFNVYPRYSKPVTAYGATFIDEGWPKKVIDIKLELSPEINNAIITDLRK